MQCNVAIQKLCQIKFVFNTVKWFAPLIPAKNVYFYQTDRPYPKALTLTIL